MTDININAPPLYADIITQFNVSDKWQGPTIGIQGMSPEIICLL